MKLIKYVFILLLICETALLSCSKDDSGGPNFGNAPTGEIVPVAQRDLVLTGYDITNRNDPTTQKWWRHIASVVDFGSGCGDNEDEEYTYTNVYLGFTPEGKVYRKTGIDGSPVDTGNTWEWTSASKDKMIFQGVEFTLTELWNIRLTIASDQSQSGCNIITWEEFINE